MSTDGNTGEWRGDGVAGFCPEGCDWECEHLVAAGTVSAERAALRPVDDRTAGTLMRCGDCGDYLSDVVAHAREHERMRQLGWLPERRPARPGRG